MLIKEYRICEPMTVEEYRIAQLYMIQKKSREESTGKESGVEILKNEPYTDGPGGSGQYTFKIYHVGSHLPGWLRSIIPEAALRVEEEAWNAYPYTKTRYRVPFVEKFLMEIETKYLDDGGETSDVFDLTPEERKVCAVDFIDIVTDPVAPSKPTDDPKTYVSEVTGRGPLTKAWRTEFQEAMKTGAKYTGMGVKADRTGSMTSEPLPKRIMCSYKLCRVEFKYWGMQTKIEQFIHDIAIRRTMVNAHRQAWTWQDEWYGLTMSEIRALEAETAKALAAKMGVSGQDEAMPHNADVASKPLGTEMTLESQIHQSGDTEPGVSAVSKTPFSASALNFGSCMSFASESEQASSMFQSVKNSDVEDNDDFFDVQSQIASVHEANVTGDGIEVTTEGLLQSGLSNIDPLPCLLLFVVHGGCLQDRSADFTSKRADALTFQTTLESIIAAYYPGLLSRVIIRMVPCPAVAAEALKTLNILDPSESDHNMTVNNRLVRSFVPLGSIPMLFTTSPRYPSDLNELTKRLNESYASFCASPERRNFSGVVSVVADNLGSVMLFDILCSVAMTTPVSPADTTFTDLHTITNNTDDEEDCEKQSSDSIDLEKKLVNLSTRDSDASDEPSGAVRCSLPPPLAFDVHDVFLLGSSLGLLLAFRRQLEMIQNQFVQPSENYSAHNGSKFRGSAINRPACDQLFNLFHLADPFAYRLEPLLSSQYEQIPVVHLPPFSRKRLDLRDSVNMSNCFDEIPLHGQAGDGVNGDTGSDTTSNSHWWGPLRVDYGMFCPTGVQNILARALPPLVHSSYWESKDASSFIAYQLAERLECRMSGDAEKIVPICNSPIVYEVKSSLLNRQHNSSPSMSIHDNSVTALSRQFRVSIRNRLRFKSKGTLENRTKSNTRSVEINKVRMNVITSLIADATNPNHRANDAIFLEGQPQVINARFVFGPLDLSSLANEKVEITYRPHSLSTSGGGWEMLGSQTTDSNGRLVYPLSQTQHLPIGLHRVRLVATSDEEHPVYMTFAVVPPHTPAVICSIDGSFAASISLMGKDPKVRAGSVDIMRHWQSLGYLLIYMSARPDMQHKQVSTWLTQHNFPSGLSFFLEGIFTDPLRQKSILLTSMIQQIQLNIRCAYGSAKDIQIYRSLGLHADQIFVVGKVSRRQTTESTPIREGYAAHLQELIEQKTISKPAEGVISAAIHRNALDSASNDIFTNQQRSVFFNLTDEPAGSE